MSPIELSWTAKNIIRDGGSTSYTVNIVDPCTLGRSQFPKSYLPSSLFPLVFVYIRRIYSRRDKIALTT